MSVIILGGFLGSGKTVENIFSGCICCTSSARLCDSIKQIYEKYRPKWLFRIIFERRFVKKHI